MAGVFEALAGDATANPATPPRVVFHPASGIDKAAVAPGAGEVRIRILDAFAGCCLIERFEAREMLPFKHSGFSMNAGVCTQAHDRAGLERLLRYCARPPFHGGPAQARNIAGGVEVSFPVMAKG